MPVMLLGAPRRAQVYLQQEELTEESTELLTEAQKNFKKAVAINPKFMTALQVRGSRRSRRSRRSRCLSCALSRVPLCPLSGEEGGALV